MFCDFTIQTKTNTYITHNAKKQYLLKIQVYIVKKMNSLIIKLPFNIRLSIYIQLYSMSQVHNPV